MIEMAAEVGDGVIFNLWPRRALPKMMEHVKIGAERAGKDWREIEIVNRAMVLVTDDVGDGRNRFRAAFAPYYATPVYNRFLAGKFGGSSGSYPIRHLGSFAIGPKQRIVVLDINGEVVACGVTPNHISFLTRLGGPRQAGSKRTDPKSAPQPTGGAATREVVAADPASKDPVHQFAETLKEKVRSLKRIK